MKNELEIVNPKEFGLEEKQANELTIGLNPVLEERKVLTTQYNDLIKGEFSTELAKKARTLRLLISSNRTKGIAPWHKVNKAFFLTGGKFVDAIKNKEVRENERMEEALLEIEKREERLENERIEREAGKEKLRLEELQETRVTLISEYLEDADERSLSSMDQDVWDAYFASKKQSHEDAIKEEEEAEEKRLAEEERIETEKREKERKAWEKLEADAKAKEEADALLLKKADERIEAELNKGDSEKVKDLINDLQNLQSKYEFKSSENVSMYNIVGNLLDTIISNIKK